VGCRYGQPVVGNLRHAHRDADDGRGDDAIEQRALHPAGHKDAAQHDGDDAEDRHRGKFAQAYECSFFGHDDLGVLQSDEGDEHTDAGRDGVTQVLRNGVENHLTNIEEGDEQKDESLDEHDGQRLLPCVVHGLAKREGKEGVETHARCLCERQSCHECKEKGGDGRCQCRGCEQRTFVHAGGGEDGRIDREDVTHGQKRCRAGNSLCSKGGDGRIES